MTDVAAAAGAVLDRVRHRARRDRFLIAFSGGLDSTVLAHVAVQYAMANGLRVAALHVDHRLQDGSGRWESHCRTMAHELGMEFESVTLDGRPTPGSGLEQWARHARYEALARHADRRTCVMTAHHLDDHVETILHHVLRGSGPHGLAGIRVLRDFGEAVLVRPLLQCRRAELRRYAEAHALRWIEDPSNSDERRTRNLIRGRLVPVLVAAFPAAARSVARMGGIQGELADLLDQKADAVIEAGGRSAWQLPAASLRGADGRLRPYVLKRWLMRAGFPVPGQRHLRQILEQMLAAPHDGSPRVQYSGCEVRRYADCLYVMRVLPRAAMAPVRAWDPRHALEMPHGRLAARASRAGLARDVMVGGRISVRMRAGGERCRPAGRGRTRSLKKLFQEWQVPPWERDLAPLVFVGDALAAVGTWCVCEGFEAPAGSDALEIVWAPAIYAAPAGHDRPGLR